MNDRTRCRNCTHYVNSEIPKRKTCNNPNFTFGYDHCKVLREGMHIENDEGWGLFIGPEFGCVHFEQLGNVKVN